MKRVLVIVVTHNGMHWLPRCLSSIVQPDPGAVEAHGAPEAPDNARPGANEALVAPELYVWDNDSTDGSADYVQGHFPQAKLVRSADNLGFSKPNNEGMKWALSHGYDYAYLLNQDAWLEAGALEKLVAAAEAHPGFGLLSPLQMTDGYKELDRQFAKALKRGERCAVDQVQPMFGPGPILGGGPGPASVAPSGLQGISGGPGPGGKVGPSPKDDWTRSKDGGPDTKTPSPVSVPRVMAAHWLIPVSSIRKVGLFNEELFPLWGQDDDWCNRALYKGYKIGVVQDARAVHDRQYREEPKEKLIKRNYYTGSLVRLARLQRPLWVSFLFVCLFTLVKAVKYGSLLPFKYFGTICSQLPAVREHRRNCR